MKKPVRITFLILFIYLITSGTKCEVKTCPPSPYSYNLHHLTEKGFAHIFTVEEDCSGCHHIVAEKCGLVKIKKIKQAKNGVFTAQVEKIKGVSCSKYSSTFFPEHWSVQITLDKIEEAYNNIITKETDSREMIGKTSENISIKIIMDKYNQNKIFNAYPILENTREPMRY